jgi:hypothetical protein
MNLYSQVQRRHGSGRIDWKTGNDLGKDKYTPEAGENMPPIPSEHLFPGFFPFF